MNASTGAYDLMYERDMMPYGVNSAEEALSGVAPNARWAGSFFLTIATHGHVGAFTQRDTLRRFSHWSLCSLSLALSLSLSLATTQTEWAGTTALVLKEQRVFSRPPQGPASNT